MLKKIKSFLSLNVKNFKLKLRRFLIHTFFHKAKGILVESNFGKMIVDPLDNHITRQFLKVGSYNPEEIMGLIRILKPSHKVLIVGAHIGSLVIPISKYVRSIDAIEASPKNFYLLKANIELNYCNNVKLHHFAAAEKNGSIDFVLNVENSGGSKRRPINKSSKYYYDNPHIQKVKSFALDRKFKQNFDAIIMDIEGSEFFAIQGMQRILSNASLFVFEFIPAHLTDVANVSIKEFVSNLPTNRFKYAYLPRKKKRINIASLEKYLYQIVKDSEYEDGIILYR
jgi:FkbM family methyltransferase